jgi:chromate reductase
MMNAIEAYIQFTPNLISDSGEVNSELTTTILRNYMSEFSIFIGRVLSVYPRAA